MREIKAYTNKELSYKDIVIMLFIDEYPLKTAKELSLIINCNYARLTESLNSLLLVELIIKTEDYPPRYIKNE